MKRPSFQFYPADWRKDIELKACSIAARGLWIELMCIAHECEPYGTLTVNGRPMNNAQIAGQVGLSVAQCKTLLQELLDNGVARKTDDGGAIFSKRMVDDEHLRNVRAAGGKLGAEHGAKGGSHGSKGGRPRSDEGGKDQPHDDEGKGGFLPPLKPPPSSSSSSSSSNTGGEGGQAATPPRRGRKPSEDRTLSDWIAATQEKGEFAIPENDPVYATARASGLPAEFVQLAWFAFKRKYGPGGMGKDRKYKDWRATFRTAVSECWGHLWMLDSLTNEFRLTTAGAQAQREFESQT